MQMRGVTRLLIGGFLVALLSSAVCVPVAFAQNPLNFADNSFVTGDYVVAGAYGMTTDFSNGYAVGDFIIPDPNPGIHASTLVPPGAEVVAAFVYWQTVENSGTALGAAGSGQNGYFRPLIAGGPAAPGYPITGVSLGTNNEVTWSSGGCSAPETGKVTRTYRANVLGAFPQNSSGEVLPNGEFEIRLPSVGPQAPLTLGATLVIIYRVLSPTVPLNSVVIYDGAFGQTDSALNMTQTVQGFYDAATKPVSKLTLIAGAGKLNKFETVYLNNIALPSHAGLGLPPLPGFYGGSWDNPTWTFGNALYPEIANPIAGGASSATTEVVPTASKPGCLSWGAVIVSTTVQNSDNDGLLDSWKTANPPGYCDVSINAGKCAEGSSTDPGWVALPGAVHGQKDLFIQLDYMCSAMTALNTCTTGDGTNYSFQPPPSALSMLTTAFLNHGVHVFINPAGTIQPVHAIQEQSCTDALPELCTFPNQAGVVGWKGGYSYFKNQLVETSDGNTANCLTSPPAADCQPRFQHGRKDSWHYALFAHAVGEPEWKLEGGTLVSAVQSGNTVTFTTSTPLGTLTNGVYVNTLIDGGYTNHGVILSDPHCLLGRVTVSDAATNPNLNGTFCIATSTAPGGETFTITVPGSSEKATYTLLTDPYLAVAPGQTSSASGFSDVGGADSLITLGLWGDPTSASSNGQQPNTIAGTFMHETGHSLGLTHGGFYYDPQLVGSYVPTIEPNCKPNFQSVMNYFFQVDLLNGQPDYSEQQLDTLDEAALPAGVTYEGGQPFFPNTKWYTPIPPQGVGTKVSFHCNGTPPLATDPPTFLVPGAPDPTSPAWDRPKSDVDFDGTISLRLRGYSEWAAGGTALGGVTTGIDLRQISASGNVSVLSQASFFGGGQPFGGGGQPFGGGGQPFGGGGQPFGGGGQPFGGGGEINQQTADSYTRPPTNLAATEGVSPRKITLTWTAPTFGQIGSYEIYRSPGGGQAFAVVATVSGNPPVTTYTDTVTCDPTGYEYFVTALLSSTSTNPGQQSVPSNIVTLGPVPSEPLTGCYAVNGSNAVTVATGFASPTSGASYTQGTTVPITIPVTDDYYPTGGTVPVTANKTLVAIGPFPYDGNCPTISSIPVYLNYAGTYPQPYTVLSTGGAGITDTSNQFMYSWSTSTANAGCYVLEADFDSGQVDRTEIQLTIFESENTPHFLSTTVPNGTAAIPYSNAIQEAGGIGLLTWSISSGALPPGLSIGPGTGTISGTPTTAGSYNFTVKVVDSKGNFGTQAFTMKVLIFVSDAPVLAASPWVTPNLPNGTAAIPYNNMIYETGAVPGALTWTYMGTPPAGMSFNASGTVTGTPTNAGTYNFTATVTDSGGNTGSLAFTVKVLIFVSDAAPLNMAPYVSPTLPNGTAGISYANTLYETGAAAGTLTWSYSGSLPPGVAPTPPTSNMLSGTPTTAGTYMFTATVTDSAGNMGSLQFTQIVNIFVSYDAPSTIYAILPAATAGVSYSNLIQQYGAVGAVTWSYTGTPPPGLSLSTAAGNSGDGQLSGTPSMADIYNFTAIATDSKGDTGSLPFTITVNIFESDSGVPNVTKTLPPGTVGSSYSNQIDQDGATLPLTWTITAGALPPGLSIGTNSGMVSGTPTAPGSYTFTAQVTDSASPPNVTSLQFMLNVADAQYGDLIVVDGSPSANPLAGTLFRVTPTGASGTIAAISTGQPTGVAVDANSGNIYVSVAGSTPSVTRVGLNGALNNSFVSGSPLTNPVAVAVDASGNVYVADNNTNEGGANAIYEFNSSGTVVGQGAFAQLPSSNSISNHIRMTFDSSGNLDVASDTVGGVTGQVEVDQIPPAPNNATATLYSTALNGTYSGLSIANNASGGSTTYSGTFTTPPPVGSSVVIAGFSNAGNNGTFTVQSSSTSSVTVNNPNGTPETPDNGTATLQMTVGGIAVLSDGSIDLADYTAQTIYNIAYPGTANMAISIAIGPTASLCCNISGMANPPGAPTTLYLTLDGSGTPQLAQVVPSTSTVSTVSSTQTYALTAVSAPDQHGNVTYTGTFSPTIPANAQVTISGFTNATNNGPFTVVSCTGTTLVVNNSGGLAETNPGAAAVATPLTSPNDVAWYSYPPAPTPPPPPHP
jgi:hypothetical protein